LAPPGLLVKTFGAWPWPPPDCVLRPPPESVLLWLWTLAGFKSLLTGGLSGAFGAGRFTEVILRRGAVATDILRPAETAPTATDFLAVAVYRLAEV